MESKMKDVRVIKFFAAIVTGMLLLTLCFINSMSSKAAVELKGEGTKENPYMIGTAEELAAFRDMVNKSDVCSICNLSAKLTADIVINDIYFDINDEGSMTVMNSDGTEADIDELTTWEPIGYFNSKDDYVFFGGTFAGNNHSIRGIYICDTNKDYAGLFAATDSAVIGNLTVADSYIQAHNYVGGITGFAFDTVLYDCYYDDEDEFDYYSYIGGNNFVGGVCGAIYDMYKNSKGVFNSNKLKLLQYDTNCGVVIGNKNTGGVCGLRYYAGASKCHNDGYMICDGDFTSDKYGTEIMNDGDEKDNKKIVKTIKNKNSIVYVANKALVEQYDGNKDKPKEAAKDTRETVKNDLDKPESDSGEKPSEERNEAQENTENALNDKGSDILNVSNEESGNPDATPEPPADNSEDSSSKEASSEASEAPASDKDSSEATPEASPSENPDNDSENKDTGSAFVDGSSGNGFLNIGIIGGICILVAGYIAFNTVSKRRKS